MYHDGVVWVQTAGSEAGVGATDGPCSRLVLIVAPRVRRRRSRCGPMTPGHCPSPSESPESSESPCLPAAPVATCVRRPSRRCRCGPMAPQAARHDATPTPLRTAAGGAWARLALTPGWPGYLDQDSDQDSDHPSYPGAALGQRSPPFPPGCPAPLSWSAAASRRLRRSRAMHPASSSVMGHPSTIPGCSTAVTARHTLSGRTG